MIRSLRLSFFTYVVAVLCLYIHQTPTAVAGGNTWESFKRVRQGDAAQDDSASKKDPVATTVAVPAAQKAAPPNPPKPGPAVGTAANDATPTPQPPPAQDQPAKPVAATTTAPATPSPAAVGKPDRSLIRAPQAPTEEGGWWKFYAGTMAVHANPYYDPHGVDFKWAYSRKDPLPTHPRVVVHMHGSGGGQGAMGVFGPSTQGDIEVRAQDAEAYNQDWREWWTFGRDGTPYPGRRIVATLQFLRQRYQLDLSVRGIVLQGPSMGGAGAVIQTMILPSPWREYIAYSSARAGVIMPRQIARRDPGQYANFPPDDAQHKALWDSIDFAVRAATDRTVQGIHYRHAFSSDDQFSAGVNNASTQLEFVNLIERHKIGGAFGWVKAGHSTYEQGVNLPDLSEFEAPEQDVTLDRAHPAVTRSTGNYPLLAADRVNHTVNPRGHYNMGITWNHAGIVDDTSQIVFPLKYTRRAAIGGGIPDQPERITISVTPRRAKHFQFRNGETLQWSWDNGARSGEAMVKRGTVTIDAIPLQSGDPYKTLRIHR